MLATPSTISVCQPYQLRRGLYAPPASTAGCSAEAEGPRGESAPPPPADSPPCDADEGPRSERASAPSLGASGSCPMSSACTPALHASTAPTPQHQGKRCPIREDDSTNGGGAGLGVRRGQGRCPGPSGLGSPVLRAVPGVRRTQKRLPGSSEPPGGADRARRKKHPGRPQRSTPVAARGG